MDIEIKKMEVTDLENIKDILEKDFDDFWDYSVFKSELNSTSSYFIMATLDSEIIGFAGIKVILDDADIMNIVVKKDFRNKGIGNKLLNSLIMICKNLNLKAIFLEVKENNNFAIQLYKSLNFQEIGIRKKYYNNSINAIIMNKKL